MAQARRIVISLALAFSVAVGPVAAFAQDPHDPTRKAEIHYQTAVSLFGEGRYREALDEFDLAIEIHPEPVFYCNRALVQIKLQETAEAVESLRVCRDGFEGDSAELAAIDAQLKGVSMYQYIVRPGSMTIAQDIATGGAEVVPVEPPGWDMADFGYLTMGLGVALLASALTLDLVSSGLKEDFLHESEGGPGTSLERYQELKDELDVRRGIFVGLAASGAVITATGLGLVIVHFVQSDDAAVTIFPIIGDRNQAGVGLQVEW